MVVIFVRAVISWEMVPGWGVGRHCLCKYRSYPVFPVWLQIFPVSNYRICDYYIHKTDMADLSSFKKIRTFFRQIPKYLLPLESGNLQLAWANKLSLLMPYECFGKISKFPVIFLTGIFFAISPVFSVQSVLCHCQTISFLWRSPIFCGWRPPPSKISLSQYSIVLHREVTPNSSTEHFTQWVLYHSQKRLKTSL